MFNTFCASVLHLLVRANSILDNHILSVIAKYKVRNELCYMRLSGWDMKVDQKHIIPLTGFAQWAVLWPACGGIRTAHAILSSVLFAPSRELVQYGYMKSLEKCRNC